MRTVTTALLACALLAGCAAADGFHEWRVLAMGTWVDVALDPGTPEPEKLAREVEAFLRVFERDYYAWSDGELAAVNAALMRGHPAQASPELAELLAAAQRISLRSDGAFEPAVGDLVELWGLHVAPDETATPPDPRAIERWLARAPSIRTLAIDPDGTVRAADGGVTLDLGGIAKGAAVDRLLELLARHGVGAALVNAGGDLRVLGSRGGRPWRIGVRAPRSDGLLGIIELADGEAAFTSGDYERYYEHAGRRVHHILDPATGYPVEHTQAVTVVAANGVAADAAATALLVAGPAQWRRIAAALGITTALRVDASGLVETTPQMRERLQTADELGSDIMVPGP